MDSSRSEFSGLDSTNSIQTPPTILAEDSISVRILSGYNNNESPSIWDSSIIPVVTSPSSSNLPHKSPALKLGTSSDSAILLTPKFTFKIKFGKIIQKVICSATSIRDIQEQVQKRFGHISPSIPLKMGYWDEEGDLVHLETDEDLRQGVSVAQRRGWTRLIVEINQDIPNNFSNNSWMTSWFGISIVSIIVIGIVVKVTR